MKNKIFIIFVIHILQGAETQKLPTLRWQQSLKETSHKNIILSSLASLSLGLLTHTLLQKDKLWLKKASTGIAILAPFGISAARSIYFGKIKNENFDKNDSSRTTKDNIFLERLYLLAKAQPQEAYKIFNEKRENLEMSKFKKGQDDPLFRILVNIQQKESEESRKEKIG
jgi:hypothetical protein